MAVVCHQGGVRERPRDCLPRTGDVPGQRSRRARVGKRSCLLTEYVRRAPELLDFDGCRRGCGERVLRAVVVRPSGRSPAPRP